jgi:hypothetical protein
MSTTTSDASHDTAAKVQQSAQLILKLTQPNISPNKRDKYMGKLWKVWGVDTDTDPVHFTLQQKFRDAIFSKDKASMQRIAAKLQSRAPTTPHNHSMIQGAMADARHKFHCTATGCLSEVAKKKCSVCAARYCDVICQAGDWKKHRKSFVHQTAATAAAAQPQ